MVVRFPANRHAARCGAVRSLLVLAAAVAIALTAVSGAAAQPQGAAAKPRWIVFTGRPPGLGSEAIFRVQPSGKGLKRLTKGAYPAEAPAFSPDGKRIAFARLGVGIFSMNVDGSGLRALTKNARDSFPAWSPDGSQIAFIRPLANRSAVYVMPAKGGRARQLSQAPSAGRPSWTTEGLLIPTNGELAKIDLGSGQVQRLYGALIDASVGMDTTVLSPDRTTITFVGPRPPDPGDTGCGEGVPCQRFALYIQNFRAHKQPKVLLRDGGPASFSPDGKRLAYVERNRLVLQVLAKGVETPIETGRVTPTTSTPPVWQPR
jgi:Tol biopolymer transport system component